MSNINVTGQQAYFNEDAKFFKDVYIYGTLYYEFESKTKEIFGDIEVRGNATFNGPVVFNDSVDIRGLLIVKELTVTDKFNVLGNSLFSGISTFNGNVITNEDLFAKRLNVSEYFGVGIGSTVISASGLSGNVGINSIFPEQKLDVSGSIKIDEYIYDSVNSPGNNGFYLSMDEEGIRWVSLVPSFTEGIFIQDEGVYIPTTGIAQSFTALNFKQINSLGLGTDTIIPIPNPSNPSFIADIQSQDLWGFNSESNIYRMTNVGIQNSNPTSTLDITGTLHVTGAVNFDSTLDVDGVTTLNNTLDVDGATTLNNTLDVDGATTLNNTLDVDGATTLNNTLDVDGDATLNATLDVDGATTLNSTLDVDGDVTLNATLDVDGATTLNRSIL
jgi:cytoskeletal protein CcmA (bactofilin family)